MNSIKTCFFCSFPFVFFFFFSPQSLQAQQQNTAQVQLGKSPLQEVIKAMTLDEKIRLVVGTAMPQRNNGVQTFISKDKVAGAAGQGFAIPRLNIPALVYADGPAGVRIDAERKNNPKTYYATAFPVASLLASTWDTALVKSVGRAIGNEVREYGVDVLLAPGINIHRNPLTGRNFEYYSEDPLLTGLMTTAMINGVQSNGVGTSIKHFAVNNQETERTSIDAVVSERALREIYLRGFQIAIRKAQPWTVMSAYNKINGTYSSHSHDLLTSILRNEWGFKGFVMTDWWAGQDPVVQMKAGNDLLMPGSPEQIEILKKAIADGSLSIGVLDTNVERILKVISHSPAFRNYKYSDNPDLKKHAQIVRSAAADGMVLLKNENNTLPFLKATRSIALFGNSAYDIFSVGSGSGNVNKAYEISLSEGLVKAGYKLNANLNSSYKNYIAAERAKQPKENFWKAPIIAEKEIPEEVIGQLSNESDLAIISIGRNSGEGEDRKLEDDYSLTRQEKNFITGISSSFHAKGKKVIVVLNIGGVMEIASWRNNADAILLTWQPGQDGGDAITDVLSGKVNPSGKLASTFPMQYEDIPSSKNFPGTPKEKPTQVRYEEGIYVGYRYFSTFNVKPVYEFGYGLSYTKFSYSNLKLSSSSFNEKLTAIVKITNTGKAAGKEVVQLYLTAPSKTLEKPSVELKGFAKTKLLQPGSSELISFTIKPDDLASFDTALSAWNAEAGIYILKIGASSSDIKQQATFVLPESIVTEKVNKVLVPQTLINELKR